MTRAHYAVEADALLACLLDLSHGLASQVVLGRRLVVGLAGPPMRQEILHTDEEAVQKAIDKVARAVSCFDHEVRRLWSCCDFGASGGGGRCLNFAGAYESEASLQVPCEPHVRRPHKCMEAVRGAAKTGANRICGRTGEQEVEAEAKSPRIRQLPPLTQMVVPAALASSNERARHLRLGRASAGKLDDSVRKFGSGRSSLVRRSQEERIGSTDSGDELRELVWRRPSLQSHVSVDSPDACTESSHLEEVEGLDFQKQDPRDIECADEVSSMRGSSVDPYADCRMSGILSDEFEESEYIAVNLKCPGGVLNPQFSGRLMWDIAVILAVLSDSLILPFQFAYKQGDNPDKFDDVWFFLTTVFFASDLVVNFFTGYFAGERDKDVEPGTLITDKGRIARNYIRTWLVVDLVSIIPWGEIADLVQPDQASGSSSSSSSAQMAKLTKVLKFVRVLRLFRMLRLAKLANIWERVEERVGSFMLLQLTALFRTLFAIVCICHWNACIWWLVGQPMNQFTELLLSGESQLQFASTPHWTTITREYRIDGLDGSPWRWIDRSISDVYVFCFYWTLGVMRTMPSEAQPVNRVERLYVMCFMFFAFSAFSISIAQITQSFFKLAERKRLYSEHMAAVRLNMRKEKTPESVQKQMKVYLRFLFDRHKILAKEERMFERVPKYLLNKVKFARIVTHLRKIELFRSLPNSALYLVNEISHIHFVARGETLALRGRVAEFVWILVRGRFAVMGTVSLHGHDNITTQGQFNGCVEQLDVVDEACILTSDWVTSASTVKAATVSEVIKVDKWKFLALCSKNPAFKQHIQRSLLAEFPKALDDDGGDKKSTLLLGENHIVNQDQHQQDFEEEALDAGTLGAMAVV